MNREIKFRGKRKDNGKWVYGYYCAVNSCPTPITFKVTKYIVREDDIKFEIIPETVGQYVRLKDKNGKEIFEGDIVKKGSLKAEIESFEHMWETIGILATKKLNSENNCICPQKEQEIFSKSWEIIGNKFDNLELFGDK